MLFTYERINKLNDLEFEVYNQVLAKKEKLLPMTIRDFAEITHVSTTVVLNFCKKIDCNGWTEFKLRYKDNLNVERPKNNQFSPIIDHLQMYNEDKVKQKNIEDIILKIKKKKRIIFIGAGPSGVIAKYGSMLFSNYGKSSQFIDSPYYFIPDDDFSETMVIAVSTSGETKSVLSKLSRFKALNAEILAITNTGDNSIAKLSDISLNYHVENESYHLNEEMSQVHVTTTTQVPVLYLIELLAKKSKY